MKRKRSSWKSRGRVGKYRHYAKRGVRLDKRSIRTIRVGKHGKLMRVGCPVKHWKRGRCRVGMKAFSLLAPVGKNPRHGMPPIRIMVPRMIQQFGGRKEALREAHDFLYGAEHGILDIKQGKYWLKVIKVLDPTYHTPHAPLRDQIWLDRPKPQGYAFNPRKPWTPTLAQFHTTGESDVDAPIYGMTPSEAKRALAILGYRIKGGKKALSGLLQLQEQMRYNLAPWRAAIHRARTEAALQSGADVPSAVLADYPDLAGRIGTASNPTFPFGQYGAGGSGGAETQPPHSGLSLIEKPLTFGGGMRIIIVDGKTQRVQFGGHASRDTVMFKMMSGPHLFETGSMPTPVTYAAYDAYGKAVRVGRKVGMAKNPKRGKRR